MSDSEHGNIDIEPVEDWTTDWDHHAPAWQRDPFSIWDDLRGQCPMAHTGRYNDGVWLPLSYDDVNEIAHDAARFSSDHSGLAAGGSYDRARFPPIHNDPPDHMPLRRTLLPFFAPKRIELWESSIREHCRGLAVALAERGRGDAAVDYAQHIPVGAIAAILGLPPGDGEQFRTWIHDFLERGVHDVELRTRTTAEIRDYMAALMADRRANPGGDDLISQLVIAEIDGRLLDDDTIERMLILQLVAGIDTTWSSIGAALWHLASHPDDRARLVAEPELIPTAVEEFLRAYAPVSMVRRVAEDVSVNGTEMSAGDHVLLAYPSANRDPRAFEGADQVIIDREHNRHVAFGSGIHRCLGSNLARLEMNVAVEEWLRHIPDFSLQPDAEVTWAEGQIRGPRSIPVVVN